MLQPRVIIYLVLFSVLLYSCKEQIDGCTDSNALNYNPEATHDDGSCIPKIYGCTVSSADNYNTAANVDDGSCICNREMFYGTYDITSNCTDLPNGSPDTTEYVMEIYADSSNYCKVKIFNYRNFSSTQSCFVSGNNILVPSSSNFNETFGYDIIDNTTITLSNDTLYIYYLVKVNGDEKRYCDMIGIKQ